VTSGGSHRTTKTATARKYENADQVRGYNTDEESICKEQDPDWDMLEAGNYGDDAEIPNTIPHSRNLIRYYRILHNDVLGGKIPYIVSLLHLLVLPDN
jgi:hypothetical protein